MTTKSQPKGFQVHLGFLKQSKQEKGSEGDAQKNHNSRTMENTTRGKHWQGRDTEDQVQYCYKNKWLLINHTEAGLHWKLKD